MNKFIRQALPVINKSFIKSGLKLGVTCLIVMVCVPGLVQSACQYALAWSTTYIDASSSGAAASSVAIDGNRNIIVGVRDAIPAESWNMMIRKYDADGNFLWSQSYNNPNDGADHAWGVAVDAFGNIVVSGTEERLDLPGEGANWLVRKYDSGGTLLWSRTYDSGTVKNYEIAYDVAFDQSGNVIAVGAQGDGTLLDFADWVVKKYDSAGNIQWTRFHNGPNDGYDVARAVVADSNGNVIVVGHHQTPPSAKDDWVILKYDSAGTLLWNRTYNSPANDHDQARGVAVWPNNDIVVAGWEFRTDNGELTNWLIRKYDPNGNLLWSQDYDLPGSGGDSGSDVAVDLNGDLVVVGYSGRPDLGPIITEWAIRKYDLNAVLLWSTTYIEPNSWTDYARAVAVDSEGAIVVSGVYYDTVTAHVTSLIRKYFCPKVVLESVLTVSPSSASVGQWVTVALTVTNTGTADATAMAPSFQINTGVTLMVQRSGPSPPGPLMLGQGLSQVFSWTFSVSGAGTVSFTGTVSGTDSWSGDPVSSSASVVLSTAQASMLDAALAVSPTPAIVGQWVQVTLTVTNTGGVNANTVSPALQINSGGALVGAQGVVSPSGPLTLTPGGTQTFTWTYSVSGAGTVSFTGTASGSDSGTGNPVSASSSAVLITLQPSMLDAAMAIAPASVVVGQWVQVTLTVTNTGGSDANGVSPALQIDTGGTLVAAQGVVTPTGPVTLVPDSAQTFTWTYSVSGAGTVSFTGTASGTNSGSGVPILASASGVLTTTKPLYATLVASLADLSAPVDLGTVFEVVLAITNTGTGTAVDVSPAMTLNSGAALLILVSGPVPAGPLTINAGATQSFTWRYEAQKSGTVFLTAQANGVDATSGATVTASAAGSMTLQAVPPPPYRGSVRVFPNPYNPATAVRGTVKFEGLPIGAIVRIYTVRGLKVWEGEVVTPFIVEWDGRSEDGKPVAPTTYLWIAKGDGVKERGTLIVE